MTEVCQRMLSDKGDDATQKCRERRRRRIEMRLAAISAPYSAASTSHTHSRKKNRPCVAEAKRIRTFPETSDMKKTPPLPPSSSSSEERDSKVPAAVCEAQSSEPVFGSLSVSGRSREMEDAISVRTSIFRPEVNGQQPVHFFAVYDGHGGPHVAALCKEKMHVFLEEELMLASGTAASESVGGIGSSEEERGQHKQIAAVQWKDMWRRTMVRTFQRMDEVAVSTCACGSVDHDCGCHSVSVEQVALGGTTAVVAVLTSQHIIVANCGDSRAVLCRGGRAIPLSHDHKPDRPDELERIEAAGGRVIFVNGARVEGILAMSRAIGDGYLKPVVTAEPEITFTEREPEDECLILASDGLWDVMSSELACEVASECLRDGEEGNGGALAAMDLNTGTQIQDGTGELYPSRCVLAATLLTRLALGRKSSDNISVIVVHLKKS